MRSLSRGITIPYPTQQVKDFRKKARNTIFTPDSLEDFIINLLILNISIKDVIDGYVFGTPEFFEGYITDSIKSIHRHTSGGPVPVVLAPIYETKVGRALWL